MNSSNKPVELVPEHICPITGLPISAFKAEGYYAQQKKYKKQNSDKIKIARILKAKQNDKEGKKN